MPGILTTAVWRGFVAGATTGRRGALVLAQPPFLGTHMCNKCAEVNTQKLGRGASCWRLRRGLLLGPLLRGARDAADDVEEQRLGEPDDERVRRERADCGIGAGRAGQAEDVGFEQH